MANIDCPINLKECETFCNEQQVYPAMKHLIEVEKMSQRKAGDTVEEFTKGKVTSNRARHVYQARTPTASMVNKVAQTGQSNKTLKKHTKPEINVHLDAFKEAIQSDDISDKDLKSVFDTASEKVALGRISTKATASIAAAHKLKAKKNNPQPQKPKKSLVERVTNAFHFVATHMDAIMGKGPKKLTVKERRMFDTEVRRLLPYFLRTLLHMGVDLDNVIKEAIADYRKELQDGKDQQDTELRKSHLDETAVPRVEKVPQQMPLF